MTGGFGPLVILGVGGCGGGEWEGMGWRREERRGDRDEKEGEDSEFGVLFRFVVIVVPYVMQVSVDTSTVAPIAAASNTLQLLVNS